jgi:hypothetical protein
MIYGHDKTWHQTEYLDVETDKHGTVVAVWFRCMLIPFKQSPVNGQRAKEMEKAYASHPLHSLVAVELDDERTTVAEPKRCGERL